MKFRTDVLCQNLSSHLEYLHIFHYRQSTASFTKIGAAEGIFYLCLYRLQFSSDLDTIWCKNVPQNFSSYEFSEHRHRER